MFFLRPHGRHERVSQEDSEEAAVTTNSSSSSDNNGGQQHQPIRQSDLQSALAAAGIESIHQPSPSAADSLSPSDDNTPANTNTTSLRNDPSRSSSNTNSSLTPPPAPPSATSPVLSESPSSERSELNNNSTSLSEQQHYPPHPAMIRTSPTCTLLLFFFLLRLWIEAIIEKDIGLIFISLMGTTWCYRWYVIRREAEREWLESANDNELSVEGGGGTTTTRTSNRSGADAAVDFDPDLGLMSFQAQLAMAILESQRQMFENGGYGGNDNPSSENGPGVTTEAKQSWTRYEWGKCGDETMEKLRAVIHKSDSKTKIGGSGGSGGDDYGSVSVVDTDDTTDVQSTEMNEDDATSSSSLSKLEERGLLVKSLDEEEPSCSICLCEYENGETVTKLPCNHIYHESCIGSWAEHHVRCPLCNYDLMTGFEQPESVRNQQNNEAEQLAFRNMALSALGGRRIRARTSRRSGGGNRRSAARYSSALAAAEDSIV